MRHVGLSFAVLGLVAVVAAVVTTSGCKRACESAQNCRRTCECVNENTDTRQDCTIAFRCEGATETCEDAFDAKSCDEVCEEYAAKALCGVARCQADEECERKLSCPFFDANGQPTGQFFDCTVPIACDQVTSACGVRSIAADADLCANECAAALGNR